MINLANITATAGSVMVPVVNEKGSLMAYLLYPDPVGIVQEYYPCQYYPNTIPILSEYSPQQLNTTGNSRHANLHDGVPFLHKNAFGWTGQPFIQSLKSKKMSTTSSNGITAERFWNDPAFERTQENAAEFTRAGKAAKLLRSIFREVTIVAKDKITHGRLVSVFSRIVATDAVNERGERTANNGDLLQLQGFDFNDRAGIRDVFFVRCPVSVNRPAGQVEVSIPAFVPRILVQGAPGTTHFRIVAAAATINFDTEAYEYVMQGTPELPWDHAPTAPATLSLALPAGSGDTIVVALGIEYYQRVNTRSYALKTGEYNATSIVKVDVAA